ncbi:MAG TPA: hypothetical protein VNG51_19435 [Ktedonobacteraceae bacterium]|nr:hypothetical protein [Ktedonobacteraceae bacterium]
MSGTYNIQLLTLTTTTLGPGLYYMAMSCDNTTANFAIQQIGQSLKTPYTGLAQMDSAFPLPASATFATLGQDQIPLFGLSTRSTI